MISRYSVQFLDMSLPSLLSALALVERNPKMKIQLLLDSRDRHMTWSLQHEKLSVEHRKWLQSITKDNTQFLSSRLLLGALTGYASVSFSKTFFSTDSDTCTFESGFFDSFRSKDGIVADACWIAEAVAGFDLLDRTLVQKYLVARFK